MTLIERCVFFRTFQAEFFWECNGENKGSHTGFIQNWIKNCPKPKSTVKRSRREIKISEAEIEAYEELCATDSTPESHPHIMQLLAKTIMYRQSMRASNRSVSEIMSEFPCLLDEEAVKYAYSGI